MTDYDVVVVGAGVAGLPAALFTGAMGLRTLVLEASARYDGGELPTRHQILLERVPLTLIPETLKSTKTSIQNPEDHPWTT